MTMVTFSVVIPCFNCAQTLGDTITSLQNQAVSDWEAICVDDGSTDQTLEILERFASQDKRIRVVSQSNSGPSRARNAAASVANGQYIAFLDSDDLWTPGKLSSVLAAFMETPHADAVFGRIAFFRTGSDGLTTTSTVRGGKAELDDFLGENPVCTLSNLTVKRQSFLAYGGFDENMRFSEDLEWLIRALAAGAHVEGVADLHVRYRTSENGLSADLHAMHDGWRRALAAANKALSPSKIASAEAVHLRYLARRALRTNASAGEAWSLLTKGLLLSPVAFLGGRHRGPMTLLGCLLAPLIPTSLRRRIFA